MPALTLKHDAWVAVLDGRKALFLRNEGDEKFANLRTMETFEQDNPPTREQGTSAPGRSSDALGNRSAVEGTDWHELGEERFALGIVEQLYAAAQKGRYDQLVLCAPPRLMGVIRKKIHKIVRERIVAEIEKDLTGHPIDEIEKIVLAG